MFQLDLKSRTSIYEQIVDNIKELILSGVLRAEDKLPSVRELSKTLTVNPNTTQKAYRELEYQGFVYTVSGLGTFVAERVAEKIDRNGSKSSKKKPGAWFGNCIPGTGRTRNPRALRRCSVGKEVYCHDQSRGCQQEI